MKQKNYMVYTDNTKDEEGNTKVYASVFKPDAEPLELLPVETEREWKIIETIITSITEESKRKERRRIVFFGGIMKRFRNIALALVVISFF